MMSVGWIKQCHFHIYCVLLCYKEQRVKNHFRCGVIHNCWHHSLFIICSLANQSDVSSLPSLVHQAWGQTVIHDLLFPTVQKKECLLLSTLLGSVDMLPQDIWLLETTEKRTWKKHIYIVYTYEGKYSHLSIKV